LRIIRSNQAFSSFLSTVCRIPPLR
jgi:hypothetical protein